MEGIRIQFFRLFVGEGNGIQFFRNFVEKWNGIQFFRHFVEHGREWDSVFILGIF